MVSTSLFSPLSPSRERGWGEGDGAGESETTRRAGERLEPAAQANTASRNIITAKPPSSENVARSS